jgi:hypothetical protein
MEALLRNAAVSVSRGHSVLDPPINFVVEASHGATRSQRYSLRELAGLLFSVKRRIG